MIRTEFKAHPIMIWRVMKPYLFVLILPLVRALVQYLVKGEIDGLLALELIAVSVVVTIAVLGWRSIRITVDDRRVTVQKGVFIKSYASIDVSRISSVSLKQNIIDYIFRTVDCSINTEAGRPRKSDFNIKMGLSEARRFYSILYGTKNMKTVKFSAFRIALLAATTSSAVTGVIIGVPVINQTSKVIGVAISDALLYEINVVSSKFSNIFPPIVNAITIIFLIAYGVSFIVAFLKNVNFRLKSDRNNIEVRSGIVVRKKIIFKKSMVNDVCFEQTPLMRLLKKHSMRASVGGYGDSRGEKAIIVPVAKHKELEKQLKNHFPFIKLSNISIAPYHTTGSLYRFLYIPMLIALAILGVGALVAILFERFSGYVLFLTLVALGIDLYYGSICYHNYKFGGFRLGQYVFASGSSGFTVRELYCDKNKIGVIKISQTPADRRFDTCKVKFTVRSENADSVKVKNLDKSTAVRYINNTFELNINE